MLIRTCTLAVDAKGAGKTLGCFCLYRYYIYVTAWLLSHYRMSVTKYSSWPSVSPWFITLLEHIQSVSLGSSTVCTLNSFATSRDVVYISAWRVHAVLAIFICSWHKLIYSRSSGYCPLIQKVPTNKQKQDPEWVKWRFLWLPQKLNTIVGELQNKL